MEGKNQSTDILRKRREMMASLFSKISSSPKILLILAIILFLCLLLPLVSIPFIGRHSWNEGIYSSMANDLVVNGHPVPFEGMTKPDFGDPHLFEYLSIVPRIILGQSELAYRIISIVSGIITLIAIWHISASLGSLSRFAPLLTATIPVFLYYSARAQADVLGLAMMSLSFLFITKAVQPNSSGRKNMMLAGIFSGLAIYSQFEFAFVLFALVAILCSGNLRKGKTSALKSFATVFLIALIPFGTSIIIENAFFPSYYPYKFFLARFSLPGFAESSSSAMVSANLSNLVSVEFSVIGIVLILGCMGIIAYVMDILVKKSRRIPLLEGSIALFFVYTLFSFKEISHFQVHEYLFLPIILPLVILSSFMMTKSQSLLSRKLHHKGLKLASILLAGIILISLFFGIAKYCNFYLKPLSQEVPDSYGNNFAVNAGRYISSLPIRSKSVIICQSDVIGVYSNHPYIIWYDIWSLNFSKLRDLSVYDLIIGKPLYDTANIFDLSKKVQVDALKILSSWNLSCVVISPEITDVMSKSNELSNVIDQNFVAINSFGPYTIMVSVNDLPKKQISPTPLNWKLHNAGTNGNATYSIENSLNSSNTLQITSKNGNSTHWFIDVTLNKPQDLSSGYISFEWLGRGTGQFIHVWAGNDNSNRQIYSVFDTQVGWTQMIVPLSKPASIIGQPNASNATLIGIGDFEEGESPSGQFAIQNITFWSALSGA